MVTAGFRWQPEIGPIAYAMVSTVSPNASDTPSRPMPTVGNVAASTALPQPPSTNHIVPSISAMTRRSSGFIELCSGNRSRRAPVRLCRNRDAGG